MSVWAIAPSIRPHGGTLPAWKAAGYSVAVLRQGDPVPEADITIPTDRYMGWGKSINILSKMVFEKDPECDWVCNANDDTLPDPNHAPEVIAAQCADYFGGRWDLGGKTGNLREGLETFGVMQPIGDLALWAASRIDTFAGSPWIGREFARRMYGGSGPMFEGFLHMYGDQELQEVAQKLGVFWQRPDMIHQHNHCQRHNPHGAIGGDTVNLPGFLTAIYGPLHWQESKALFYSRRAAGFPGHEPIP